MDYQGFESFGDNEGFLNTEVLNYHTSMFNAIWITISIKILWDLESYTCQNLHSRFTQWNYEGCGQKAGIKYYKSVINVKWLPRNSQQEADPPIL